MGNYWTGPNVADTACDNFPDWQGCECEQEIGHDGPHVCVCGARWDDDGQPLDRDGKPTGLDLPRIEDKVVSSER